MSNYKIIMTGGGTAGHVTPNLALIPKLKELGYEIQYIGSKDGIEKEIIEKENIKYYGISSGKLRRYFDWKNFSDPFRVLKGISEAKKIIKKEKPNIVFSKGGFVSVPVVIAAHSKKVPVIAHESDITPGLANKISTPYCTKVCVTFPESLNSISKNKGILTGTPIRPEILTGSKLIGLKLCNFSSKKPVLMVIGGSLGSEYINNIIRKIIGELLKDFNIIHICGKGNLDRSMDNDPKINGGYRQFEYVNEELPHLMQVSDIVISRAGANVIFELLALKKPNLLIPLSKRSSRGDQILNAKSFEKSGYSMVLEEEEITEELLIEKIQFLYKNRSVFIQNMIESGKNSAVDDIINLIKEYS